MEVYFQKGKSDWNGEFKENGFRMQEFLKDVNRYMEDSSYVVLGVNYRSETSPEGSMQLNEELSRRRGESITGYIHKHIIFAEHQISITELNEDWDHLLKQVETSAMPYRDEVLQIFHNTLPDDSRGAALRQLGGGKAWEYMTSRFFPEMRKVTVVVRVGTPEPEVEQTIHQELAGDGEELQEGIGWIPVVPLKVGLLPVPAGKGWYVKTNLSGLGFLIANIHVEADLGSGLSVALPIYYSASNYFSRTCKYRTFTLQPELRYWFNGKYTSFYAAAHAGLGWYNFTDGKWRIQDKDGRTPAIGGGISAGYRLPLQKNSPRWFVELGVGAGVYPLHYDRFHNEKDGALESTRKETYFGIDQLSVNLVYKFKK